MVARKSTARPAAAGKRAPARAAAGKRAPKPPAPAPAPAPEHASQRDLDKQETREALLRAGMELFAEQGLDAPSLDALCARAGFTRGAFYVHFADREAFIVAVMERATGRFLDTVLAARGQALDLHAVARAFGASVAGGSFPVFGDVPMHQFLAACARSPALRARYLGLVFEARARVTEAVREGQRAGTVRAGVDAALVAGLLVAIALGVGTMTAIDVPFDVRAHLKALFALLAPG